MREEKVWSPYDPIPEDLESLDPSRVAAEMIRKVQDYRDHMADHGASIDTADSMAADYHRLLIEDRIRQLRAE